MSQLSTPGEPSIGELTVEQARARMLDVAPAATSETVALDAASVGRVLTAPIVAVRDQPPFDASAMDGWAISEAAAPGVFHIGGESAAGHAFTGGLAADEAVRVFTGAVVPPASRVIVQEASERVAGGVRLAFDAAGPRYVRRRGGDFTAGQALLEAGARLDPWRLALAAAAGRASAAVAVRPRVAILSTGDEVVSPGGAVRQDQVFDAAGWPLAALIRTWGGLPTGLQPAHDTEASILSSLDAAEAELIVTVGGASVGEHDLVKPALARRGLKLIVDTVRMRPGKPVWFGVLADGRRVLGLPGNPASALVCAELFLRPLLAAWTGAEPALKLEIARLTAPAAKNGPREHWMRGALSNGLDGALIATPFADQESSLVTVFAAADCLIRRPAGAGAMQAGGAVEILRLARL